ncbi:hypothetical protein [Streptomyces sp. NPDC096311]|uniref:hypothetical protein n=1 Tax=Streptomyces sp. NPDC096311 TaxID=3366083 RepID=UPI00380858FF
MQLGQSDEGAFGAQFLRRRTGRSGCVGETLCEGHEGFEVAFEGFAFVVGEVELFEHLVDAVSHGQELSAGGLLGEVERAACAGQPVGALGEEVVAAVALAQVVVLPGLFAACGGSGEDGLAVDEDLDGADVAGEVVGLPVGGGEGALQDRGVVAGAGGVLVAEPLLQIVEG